MNDQSTVLPELPDEAVERIEHAVFDRIADEPRGAPVAQRRASRRRGWLTGAGIAAAFVVGVMVTPPILGSVGGTSSADAPAVGVSSDGGASGGGAAPDMASEESAVAGDASLSTSDADDGREIIATAYAQL